MDQALEALQDSLEEDFGQFGQDIVNVGKKVASLKGEMKAVLGLVVMVAIAVLIGGLIVAWQHFGFLCTPCTALCKCCCRGLSSCCRGCSAADPEVQNSADLEVQKSADLKAPKSSDLKAAKSSDLEAQKSADLKAQKQPGVEIE